MPHLDVVDGYLMKSIAAQLSLEDPLPGIGASRHVQDGSDIVRLEDVSRVSGRLVSNEQAREDSIDLRRLGSFRGRCNDHGVMWQRAV